MKSKVITWYWETLPLFIVFPSEILQRTFTPDLHLLLKWLLPLLEKDNIRVELTFYFHFIFILWLTDRRE